MKTKLEENLRKLRVWTIFLEAFNAEEKNSLKPRTWKKYTAGWPNISLQSSIIFSQTKQGGAFWWDIDEKIDKLSQENGC